MNRDETLPPFFCSSKYVLLTIITAARLAAYSVRGPPYRRLTREWQLWHLQRKENPHRTALRPWALMGG